MKVQDSFDELLQRHRGLLFSLCRYFRHRVLDVDDLLQEATIALWRRREYLYVQPTRTQQTVLVWKIARNAMVDALRRTKTMQPLPDDCEEAVEDRTLLKELREQIERLDQPDRTIVQMQLEGYSYEEIGKALGMTEKNVSVRLTRARAQIKNSFDR